jgi:hypothetical protein
MGKELSKMPTRMMANLKKPNLIKALHEQNIHHNSSNNISSLEMS